MSICNAEKRKRITNPYTECCRITNPAERSGLQIRQSGDRAAVHNTKQADAHFSAPKNVRVSPCLSVAK